MFLILIIYNNFRMEAKIFKGKNRLIPLMHTFYVREFKVHALRYNQRHKKGHVLRYNHRHTITINYLYTFQSAIDQ